MTNTETEDNVTVQIPKEMADEIDRIIARARAFRTAHM
jgi:Arc/MetJ-type ribon-helix-helix transcriptional regulator